MAFPDPQTVTLDSAAVPLPRIGQGPNSGTFANDAGTAKLTLAHAYNRRTRRTVRLDHNKVAVDPFQGSLNSKYSMSAYLVIDHPVVGYSNAQALNVTIGLLGYLLGSDSSYSAVSKLLGGQS